MGSQVVAVYSYAMMIILAEVKEPLAKQEGHALLSSLQHLLHCH